jgi:molybdopterin-guanine dinucleotide biosynthesis protein A
VSLADSRGAGCREPSAQAGSPPVIGIFVGGRGLRMGGVAKANLRVADGRTILERTLACCAEASLQAFGVAPSIWLVGESSAYASHQLPRVADDPVGVGPIGGLRAFLRALPAATAGVALAGDMPLLTAHLLTRLQRETLGAAALAPRDAQGRWQPLFARYQAQRVLPLIDAALSAEKTSLQHLFSLLASGASVLSLSEAEQKCLHDWDRPGDVNTGCPESPE